MNGCVSNPVPSKFVIYLLDRERLFLESGCHETVYVGGFSQTMSDSTTVAAR